MSASKPTRRRFVEAQGPRETARTFPVADGRVVVGILAGGRRSQVPIWARFIHDVYLPVCITTRSSSVLRTMALMRIATPISTSPGPARRGLTLIDTVLTVLIIGIMAAAAAPRFLGLLSSRRVDAAAKRIQADLARTRQYAISTSAAQTMQFNPAGETYTVPGMTDIDRRNETYSVALNAYPYNSNLVSAAIGGDTTLQFDRFGTPDSGGTITVESGGSQQTVTIAPETGRATIP